MQRDVGLHRRYVVKRHNRVILLSQKQNTPTGRISVTPFVNGYIVQDCARLCQEG